MDTIKRSGLFPERGWFRLGANYAAAIVPIDLIGRVCGHDVVGAGQLLEAEPVFGDFIDGEGKVGVEERHFFGVGQIDDMLFLPDFAKEDALPAIDPRRHSASVQLSLCLVANLPFISCGKSALAS
ncbi:hypothetical protein G6L32_14415 [Agrobacterium tumefaciens]|uniref:hypothetical protein n=1 Tax=Agrobacterium tumefaciens TaxID=358 RepID=UPI0015740786|nr:hypothetical protein [Agrobacterium tumefaciens]